MLSAPRFADSPRGLDPALVPVPSSWGGCIGSHTCHRSRGTLDALSSSRAYFCSGNEDFYLSFQDHLAIASGELTLYSVTRSDDGLYTCRVSNPTKSRSVTTKVVVGFKPQFSTTEPDIVEFVHGANSVILSCEAYGEPRPTVRDYEFIFE